MAAKPAGVWGIDLGQCALKAVRLEMIDGQVTATAFDYIEHPKILSQPDADPDALTREALEQFLSRNDLKGDTVVIGVPGQSGLARFVKLPPVDEKKIIDIVRFEAKQQIPFPLDEVVWDYQKISAGEVVDGLALETEIGLFAMKRDMINRVLQHFKDVNIEVHVVQMSPLALCNFATYDLLGKVTGPGQAGGGESAEEAGGKACVVILDIGADSSNLVITDGGKVIWQRPIPNGGNHFTRALTKDLKLTFAKAEHVKRNAVKSPDLKKILAALRPVLNEFVNEVQRSLGYFTNTHRDATIQYVIGLGNAFRLPGLQKFLQEKLQLEVRKLNHFERLEGDSVLTAPQFNENLMSFGVAYGLALQGLKIGRVQTNLLPEEIRTERLVRAKKPWAVAAAAALLLAVAGLTFGRSVEYSIFANADVKRAIDKGDSVLKEGSRIKSDFAKEEEKAAQSEAAVNRIAAGVKERYNWNLIYKYLNDTLPQPNPEAPRLPLMTRRRFTSKDIYCDDKAIKAYQEFRKKQLPNSAKVPNPVEERKLDELIKKHLIQVNIEGVVCLYADDLGPFFKNLDPGKNVIHGLTKEEEALLTGGDAEKLPKSGWVFEIRGYTYHHDGGQFILNTYLENLANPEAKGVLDPKDYPEGKLTPALKKIVRDNISFLCLYKVSPVLDPQPGVLVHIQQSLLPTLLQEHPAVGGFVSGGPQQKGEQSETSSTPAAPSRAAWTPLGEIAASSLGNLGSGAGPGGKGGEIPGGGKFPSKGPEQPPSKGPEQPAGLGGETTSPELQRLPPRTEFVILFVWREPLPVEKTEETTK